MLFVGVSTASKFGLCFFVARWLILKDKGFRLVEATALRPCRGGGVHFVFLAFACWMLTTGHMQAGRSVCESSDKIISKNPISILYIMVGHATIQEEGVPHPPGLTSRRGGREFYHY